MVAELDGGENEALDLVPLVTNVVLEVSLFIQYRVLTRPTQTIRVK